VPERQTGCTEAAMAYEYNPESSRWEVPNPHRVENLFLFGAAAVAFIGAIVALVFGRHTLQASLNAAAARPIIIAVIFLSTGIMFALYAMLQLRFFFGRNQPIGLAPELPQGTEGAEPAALALRETLRQNAITYSTPAGALNNVLYSLAKGLVFAPQRTRDMAELAFQNTACLGLLLICFVGSLIGVGNAAVRDWLAALYFVIMAVLVLLPLRRGAARGRRISERFVIALIVVAAIAPALLPYVVGRSGAPFAPYIQLPAVTLVILVTTSTGMVLLLIAALAQQVKPSRIAMAQSTKVLSMNASPSQIFIEFDREMQRGWIEKIPNRLYLRQLPRTDGTNGGFQGQVLEETQPVPQDVEPLTLSRCLNLPAYRWLLTLDFYALAATGIGTGMLLNFTMLPWNIGALVMGLSLLIVANFAFRGGNRLWRRFEFTSRLYWLECEGNFQRVQSSVGALLQDRVKTEKASVNIEDMTLRLWVAEVDSVWFGPASGPRALMSIRGLPDEAERLAGDLADFARQQAMVVAPQSDADMQRLGQINKLNAAAGLPSAASTAAITAAAEPAAAPNAIANAPRFCSQCGRPLGAPSRFCGNCGAAVVA
jgi:hypothetical protein